MTEYGKVSQKDLKVLRSFFDPSGTKQIHYQNMMAVINDPNKLSSLEKRGMNYILSKGSGKT